MRRAVLNVLLAAGFFAVAFGVLVARNAPASGYEASIYAATPSLAWLGFAFALAVAVGTTLSARGVHQGLGIALGGTTMVAIVGLPSVRNYYFQGKGDALTHLGWTRDFLQGTMYPHELFYPGVHSIASAFHLASGVPVQRAVLVTVVFLFVPFLLFVPLVVRDLSGSALAAGFAAIVSWMVLPINNVATHMGVHTNSNALFLVPVVLFAFVAYLRRRDDLERLFGLSPLSGLVLLTGAGLLLVHPQQMINVVVILAAASLVQFVGRRRFTDHPVVAHSSAYVHTLALGGLFVLWAGSNARFRDAFSGLIYGVFASDIGASSEVGQRGGSLTEIGGSLGELFVKMFLVSALVALAVGLFVLLTWLGWTRIERESKTLVTYFGFALIPLNGMFLVYFIGTPTMAFRQVGFIFVVVTILAGVALAHAFGWLSGAITTPGASAVAALVLGACLALALLTVFSTPFIYTAGQHVTEQQVNGYETAFEHGNDERLYAGYGYGVYRHSDGIYGTEADTTVSSSWSYGDVVEAESFGEGNYSGAYAGDEYYLVVTEYDLVRELEVYRGLHYDEHDLDRLEGYEGANKLVSNGEFRLYTVDADVDV
ncbi:DUF6541 family protein [Natronobiforma cellulositropha]|uniref:DUF6541 family protein n=1 Tax=Natronobiforma cellulositropha TaxID=1679076 RepID=UPI0021D5A61F|nr:DUF6541 family protein [Natronobiforma cellulositropha]